MTEFDIFEAINHIDEELLIRSETWSAQEEQSENFTSSTNDIHTSD